MMLLAVAFNAIVGMLFAPMLGVSAAYGAVGANVVAACVGQMAPNGALREGVLVEIWTGEMIKRLRAGLEATWLEGVPDNSAVVNADCIHLVDVGIDPDVLINNTTYPIDLQNLDDQDKTISLDKFQTKVTPITDDELHAISYDKMGRVEESHRNALKDAEFLKAAHAMCPTKNTASTPVLVTTGQDDGTGRKMMTPVDIVRLKAALDKAKVPMEGRRLVLCPDHVNDLLMLDQKFANQFYNYESGKPVNAYGFEIYQFANNPYYGSDGIKKAVGAQISATDRQASFAFWKGRVFKASGSLKMYYRDAQTNPQYQRNEINFRHYFIALPKKEDANVAIYSGTVGAAAPAPTPTISGADTLEVPATQGSNNRTYATSNGAAVTAQTDAEWLTVAADGNKVTFTREAYAYSAEGDNPRVATVTIGIAGTEVTKTVTVSQAMAENV